MTRWDIETGPVNRPPDLVLAQASKRKFNFHLNGPSTFSFEMPGRHPNALQVAELATDLRLRRDGQIIFGGRVMESSDTFSATEHRTTYTGTDIRGVLARRLVQRDRDYAGRDASEVVRDQMIDAQTGPSAGLGINLAALPSVGVPITRTSKAGSSVLSELTEASADLFEWDVVTLPDGTRAPRAWKTRGRTAPVDTLVFIDGEPSVSVASVTRSPNVDAFANQIRVTGGVYRTSTTVGVIAIPVLAGIPNSQPVRIAYGANDGRPVRFGFVDGEQTTHDDYQTFTIDGEVFQVPARARVTNVVQDSNSTTIEIELPTLPVTLDDGTTVHEVGVYALGEAYPDIVTQAALTKKASDRLAEARVITPAYTVDLVNGYWRGPDHIGLGDTVALRLKSGRVDEHVHLRVTDIDLTLGESGEEQVTLTVGATTVVTLDVLLGTARRLYRLQTSMTS